MVRGSALLMALIFALPVQAEGPSKAKVRYRAHTQLDFTGEKIEGKIKAPAVFYIFQRKRSLGHQAARSPSTLEHHDEEVKSIMREALRP